jgi:hypothetical protein
VLEDFEDDFPGPGGPSWLYWAGGGVGAGTDPFNPTFPHEISEDGLGEFQQAWKISFDTSTTTDWYWFGTNGGFGIFDPEYRAGGVTAEQGGNDPGNWVFSLDVRAVGALSDLALLGTFTFYDPDYDAIYGMDGNGNGMVDGAETYVINFQFFDDDSDPNGFTSNSVRLDSGSATTKVEGDIPRFANDGHWVLNFNGGSGEYQFGNNSVTIDNLKIEFSEKPAAPGDYNNDGIVNLADYTVWRDNLGATIALPNEGADITPGEVTAEDYAFWKSQFGNTAGTLMSSASVVPEPCSAGLTLLAVIAGLSACRRHRA